MPKTEDLTDKPLTPKQQRFVEEYLIDLNGTQAAIRAGYSPKTAEVQASRLLRDAKVYAAVEARKKELSESLQITQERVLKEYARIAFSDIRKTLTPGGNLLNPNDWDDDTAAAIGSIEVVTKALHNGDDAGTEVEHTHKIRTWDKKAALDSIAKYLGMFRPDAATPDVHVHIHPVAKGF